MCIKGDNSRSGATLEQGSREGQAAERVSRLTSSGSEASTQAPSELLSQPALIQGSQG